MSPSRSISCRDAIITIPRGRPSVLLSIRDNIFIFDTVKVNSVSSKTKSDSTVTIISYGDAGTIGSNVVGNCFINSTVNRTGSGDVRIRILPSFGAVNRVIVLVPEPCIHSSGRGNLTIRTCPRFVTMNGIGFVIPRISFNFLNSKITLLEVLIKILRTNSRTSKERRLQTVYISVPINTNLYIICRSRIKQNSCSVGKRVCSCSDSIKTYLNVILINVFKCKRIIGL